MNAVNSSVVPAVVAAGAAITPGEGLRIRGHDVLHGLLGSTSFGAVFNTAADVAGCNRWGQCKTCMTAERQMC